MYKVKKYKICRRLGSGVYEKCQTQKFVVSEQKRKTTRRRRPSDYSIALMNKQKVRFAYGISEKQFRNYVNEAMQAQNPGLALFGLLESRLDNVIYRAGFAKTRRMSRQMASHGHFLVNGRRSTVPSHRIKKGDVLTIREGSKKATLFVANETFGEVKAPNWLKVDTKSKKVTVDGVATEPDPFFDFQAVIEFYSR